MTWVKICGITNLEDALVAVDAGADALGFVFYEKSPRKMNRETVREIVAEVPEGVEKVGVFVDEPVETVMEIVEKTHLTAVQVYSESIGQWLAWHENNDLNLIMTLRAEVMEGDYPVSLGSAKKPLYAVLVDSGSVESPGGTGKPFNWESTKTGISRLGTLVPVVVAGGLTPANVSGAIKTLKPFGVDVASGVEIRPGKKDPKKVRAFVQAVRDADKRS
jgi:phosphoribosylanthranilate isomerase